MNHINLGIIGIGNIGTYHAENILNGAVPRLKLSAVCDIDQKRLDAFSKKHPNIALFSSADELIHSGLVHAVLIATPHFLHPELAICAFTAGLHVLTEKPAGVTISAVRRMNEAAEKAGTVFGIMWNQRTNPLFVKAKEIIQNDQLGDLKRLVWIVTNWYRTQHYYDSATWRATWAGEGGGVLMNQAPHNLDILQWLFGMPNAIYASCDTAKWHNIEVEDDATLIGYYNSGATATFITSTGEFPGTNRLEISGSKGKMVLEKGSLILTLTAQDEREFCFSSKEVFAKPPLTEEAFLQGETKNGHIAILQNFTDAILDGIPLIAPGIDGIKEIALSNAAYLSSWTEKRVSFPLDEVLFETLLDIKIKNTNKISTNKDTAPTPQPERWRVQW